jgi:hypothetical protein
MNSKIIYIYIYIFSSKMKSILILVGLGDHIVNKVGLALGPGEFQVWADLKSIRPIKLKR